MKTFIYRRRDKYVQKKKGKVVRQLLKILKRHCVRVQISNGNRKEYCIRYSYHMLA